MLVNELFVIAINLAVNASVEEGSKKNGDDDEEGRGREEQTKGEDEERDRWKAET